MLTHPRSGSDQKNLVEQGFTLVELLIVIVILGILAGIVVFAVGNLTESASTNACGTEADTVTTAVQSYKAQHQGQLPTPVAADASNADKANGWASALAADGVELLASDTVKYFDGASGATTDLHWTIDSDGKVSKSSDCAS